MKGEDMRKYFLFFAVCFFLVVTGLTATNVSRKQHNEHVRSAAKSMADAVIKRMAGEFPLNATFQTRNGHAFVFLENKDGVVWQIGATHVDKKDFIFYRKPVVTFSNPPVLKPGGDFLVERTITQMTLRDSPKNKGNTVTDYIDFVFSDEVKIEIEESP